MPNLNKGLNKVSLNNGDEYIVESQKDESSIFIKTNGAADIYATNYDDQESLLVSLVGDGDDYEITWGLYKSFRIAAGADIVSRMVPRKNKVKGGIRNIQQLGDVPTFGQKDSGRFLVGNADGKYEWGKLNPLKHFSGIRSKVTPSISSIISILEALTVRIEITGSGFYLDTEFYLYEDTTGGTANVPDNSEIQNPTNYIKNIFVAAPSSIRVYEDADLDTLDFIDSDGIVRSCVPGNEMMPSKVFKGYGKMELYVDSALTSGKDYHVLAVSANGKKKLYKNIISL